MYDYIIGTITDYKNNAIVIDNNGIGYLVYVANPYSFSEKEKIKVYIYEHITENEDVLYGFKTLEEKELFLKLISVKGLGPKMTLPILATGSIEGIMDAIERENILYLKKFPKIGEKLARQIVLDLKGKLEFIGIGVSDETVETERELEEVLLGLGYKEKEIKPVLARVDTSLTIEDQVKDALKLLLK
ncbi:MAG: Holliday junction branch migration protein RuvA [Bacilli bacterium]|nr:Holliday junction branch migration protein RuvA [Bacilli bacterium]